MKKTITGLTMVSRWADDASSKRCRRRWPKTFSRTARIAASPGRDHAIRARTEHPRSDMTMPITYGRERRRIVMSCAAQPPW